LVGAKVLEFERAITGLDDKKAIKMKLSALTKHDLKVIDLAQMDN
jgi:hypothetical protein